jgi:hypothetical protein
LFFIQYLNYELSSIMSAWDWHSFPVVRKDM